MTAHRTSPSRRQLTLLALVVLAAHALLLQASTLRLGLNADQGNKTTKAFTTRSIAPAPVPAPVVVAAAPVPRPAPKVRTEPAPLPAESTAPAESTRPEPPVEIAQSSPAVTETLPVAAAPVVAPVAAASAPASVTPALPGGGPATTPVTAIALPESVLLQYKMTGNAKGMNYFADAELGWKNTGDQYSAYMSVSAMFLGARTMTSVGSVGATGLAPSRFSDKFRSEQAAHFEADKGKITFSANTPQAPWVEGSQDRVSVFMQLGGMLAAKPGDFPVGSEITLYTVGPRDADTWTFVVENQETLQLPQGEVSTLKVTRKPKREFDQKVEIWYAPSLGYLPVRNRITQQNGDYIDQQLSRMIKP
ncbi:MAG: DUF3108 domain-containing protein [Pseudomonadota bacterium]